tara:strand:- start:3763 stop:3942 length:180 start_codon:yes stop_codon:yes gene_type:complete
LVLEDIHEASRMGIVLEYRDDYNISHVYGIENLAPINLKKELKASKVYNVIFSLEIFLI